MGTRRRAGRGGVPAAVLVCAGVCLIAALSGCASSDTATGLPEDAIVSYAFHDASVPPEYHRSESLTLSRQSARLVIDSYGEVLADETVPMPTSVWEELGRTLPDVVGLGGESTPEGCTGGTGADLDIRSADETLVDISTYNCGDLNAAVDSTVSRWVKPARELFPSAETLAPEGE